MTYSLPPTAPPGAYIEEPTNPFTPKPDHEIIPAVDSRDEQVDENPERDVFEIPISLSLLSLAELPSEDTRVVVSPAEPNTTPNATATSFYLGTSDSPRLLAIVQSSKTVHFSLNFGRRHCKFYYDAGSDNIVLHNTSALSLWVAELDIQKPADATPQRFVEVIFEGTMIMRPGPWRLARGKGSEALADLLLLRRRYTTEIKSKISSATGMKRRSEADQSSSKKKAQERKSEDSSLVFLSTSGSAVSPSGRHVVLWKIANAGVWASLKEDSEVLHFTAGNPLDHLSPGSRLNVASGGKSQTTTNAYSILHLRQIVGSRALSSVFKATHGDLGQVVVKVIQNRHSRSELRVPRIAREWVQEQSVLRQLKHPFIVQFRGSDARLFSIYMEYLPFPDLGTMHTESYFTGTDSDAYVTLHGMASALRHLEAQGIIHNDIKPANILFDRSRGPVLIDFGLATHHGDRPCLGGTPWYIGKETWEDGVRTALSDVYALGVTLLYLLKKIPLPERIGPSWNIVEVARDEEFLTEGSQNMLRWVLRVQSVASGLSQSGVEGHVRTMVESDTRARQSATSLWQALDNDSDGAGGCNYGQ
ncbi:hypothetical protein H9Q69_014163 [Fusarium xylarioides]|nr:hypothetical protein H9Q70_005303 [Fusarium xylarioides]KAG5782772.1 hypothetical protein H9Q73_003572 [Fusarium xylarioides]KAG5786758.1 hypothetical protein H9Q69_014163 [Fusarium xylarioides]KAG5814750.1 hypothetical protein H9Q71_003099 [Fusarium xylarioides]KAG5827202.1 hypothetical protein H9Q74_002724 [Fusarium xylarioides]